MPPTPFFGCTPLRKTSKERNPDHIFEEGAVLVAGDKRKLQDLEAEALRALEAEDETDKKVLAVEVFGLNLQVELLKKHNAELLTQNAKIKESNEELMRQKAAAAKSSIEIDSSGGY